MFTKVISIKSNQYEGRTSLLGKSAYAGMAAIGLACLSTAARAQGGIEISVLTETDNFMKLGWGLMPLSLLMLYAAWKSRYSRSEKYSHFNIPIVLAGFAGCTAFAAITLDAMSSSRTSASGGWLLASGLGLFIASFIFYIILADEPPTHGSK